MGILLVAVGSITIAAAAMQHRRFLRTRSADELPAHYRPATGLLLAFSLASLSLLIGVYLAMSAV